MLDLGKGRLASDAGSDDETDFDAGDPDAGSLDVPPETEGGLGGSAVDATNPSEVGRDASLPFSPPEPVPSVPDAGGPPTVVAPPVPSVTLGPTPSTNQPPSNSEDGAGSEGSTPPAPAPMQAPVTAPVQAEPDPGPRNKQNWWRFRLVATGRYVTYDPNTKTLSATGVRSVAPDYQNISVSYYPNWPGDQVTIMVNTALNMHVYAAMSTRHYADANRLCACTDELDTSLHARFRLENIRDNLYAIRALGEPGYLDGSTIPMGLTRQFDFMRNVFEVFRD